MPLPWSFDWVRMRSWFLILFYWGWDIVSICWVLSSMTHNHLPSVSHSSSSHSLYFEQGTNDQLCLAPVRILKSLWPKVIKKQHPSFPALPIVLSPLFSSFKQILTSLIFTHSQAGIWDTHKCCLISCHKSLVGSNHRRLFLWGIQTIFRLENVSREEERSQERNACLCNLPQRSSAEITHQAQIFPLA